MRGETAVTRIRRDEKDHGGWDQGLNGSILAGVRVGYGSSGLVGVDDPCSGWGERKGQSAGAGMGATATPGTALLVLAKNDRMLAIVDPATLEVVAWAVR